MELRKNAWDIELPEWLGPDTQKEYIALLMRHKKENNQQYANVLIYHNLRLVTFTLKKYYPFWRRVCPELISVGVEALVKSIYSYGERGENFNSSFETYSIGRIRFSMGYYLRKEKRSTQNVI